jgi:outer membrane lipoprotein LolB
VKRAGLFALVLLAGCTRLAPPSVAPAPSAAETAWQARQAALQALPGFALGGRVAIQREAEGGQAGLRWQQRGDRFDLRIAAPLAQGTYRLEGAPERAVLTAPGGARYSAADIDTLMTTHLAWALPVSGARYWVLGVPVPGRPVTQLSLDAQGRMQDLAQDGWRISVLAYRDVGGMALPSRLFLLGRDLKLRLAISNWTLESHP